MELLSSLCHAIMSGSADWMEDSLQLINLVVVVVKCSDAKGAVRVSGNCITAHLPSGVL